MEAFLGKWEVTSRENVDEILKAYGDEENDVPSRAESAFLEYAEKNGLWTCEVTLNNGSTKMFPLSFDLPIDSETLDGRPIESKITLKDKTMCEIHKDKNDPSLDTMISREVNGDELVVTTKVKNISSITKYKKTA